MDSPTEWDSLTESGIAFTDRAQFVISSVGTIPCLEVGYLGSRYIALARAPTRGGSVFLEFLSFCHTRYPVLY